MLVLKAVVGRPWDLFERVRSFTCLTCLDLMTFYTSEHPTWHWTSQIMPSGIRAPF